MSLLKVFKKYPETKEIILNRMDSIYSKASLVEQRNIGEDDYDGSVLVDDALKRFLLAHKNTSNDIKEILDNFEELMDSFLSKPGSIYLDKIESIISKGGLLNNFKNIINSYNNIAISYSSEEPYQDLFETLDTYNCSLHDFEIIGLLNKKYKENGKIIKLELRDFPVLEHFSNEELNIILNNWDEEYKELFNQIRLNSSATSSNKYKNDEEYRKNLNYFLNEYINLDKSKKSHLLDCLKFIGFYDIEKSPIFDTPEKIRNIDETIFNSIVENPEYIQDFLRNSCIKNYDKKYFDDIQDKDSISVIDLYNTFLECIYSGDGINAQKILKDNNLSIFELIEKINDLNNKYSEYCHKSIAKSLSNYKDMEEKGQITSRVESGCKIYELKGQPFFGILHTANANLDDFYFYEEYALRTGEYIDDEEKSSNISIDENMLYSKYMDKRSCSTIGNDFIGYVKGSKNRKVIHFGITNLDYSDILVSSNKDLDISPEETIEQISNRNMQYPSNTILSESIEPYNETLINSFNEDNTPIKFDIIYSFHTNGPTQEEIDTANRFGIDIVWADVNIYDKQRRKQLALELNSGISNEAAQKRYDNYINGRGYESGEGPENPTIEDIRQDKELALEILHDVKEKRDEAKTFNLNVQQTEKNILRGISNEEK